MLIIKFDLLFFSENKKNVLTFHVKLLYNRYTCYFRNKFPEMEFYKYQKQ